MKIDLMEVGMNIAWMPIELIKSNKFKFIRLLSWIFNYTIWLPIVLVGCIIAMLEMFQEIWEQI